MMSSVATSTCATESRFKGLTTCCVPYQNSSRFLQYIRVLLSYHPWDLCMLFLIILEHLSHFIPSSPPKFDGSSRSPDSRTLSGPGIIFSLSEEIYLYRKLNRQPSTCHVSHWPIPLDVEFYFLFFSFRCPRESERATVIGSWRFLKIIFPPKMITN
jgi:hypothetical protein